MQETRIHCWISSLVAVALVAGAMSLPAAAAPKKPTISINDASIVEGNSGEKILSFIVQIKGARTSGASVSWATADASATSPDDYEEASGTVSFAAGKQRPVRISVKGDEIDENPDETFRVNLTNAVNANISRQQGEGTILDDDTPASTLSISGDAVGEGDAGTTTASFEVTLSQPAAAEVSVDWATANGTATTADNDYASGSGTLTFIPGDTTEFASVDVNGDTTSEPDENFTVTLSGPEGATLGDATATGRIIDDEGSPAVSIEDVTVDEGDSGTTAATFEVTLSNASSEEISVPYAAAAAGTAALTDDFQSSGGGTLVFAAGDRSHDVTVQVVGDNLDESDEFFTVGITKPPNASEGDMEGKGFITDDDTTRVSVTDTSATEGSGPAAFTIRLTKPSGQNVAVVLDTADGTAKATTDYVAKSRVTLIFADEQTSKTVDVGLINDRTHEPRESFSLSLNQTLNAELGRGVGTATVRDNDRAPSTTTLKARKRSGRVRASGRLSPAHKGRRMAVTLKKRRDGRWVKVRTKRPLLSGRTDINGDGVRDSRYSARFFNPRNTKRCRVIARFPGDLHHRPSTARKTFNC